MNFSLLKRRIIFFTAKSEKDYGICRRCSGVKHYAEWKGKQKYSFYGCDYNGRGNDLDIASGNEWTREDQREYRWCTICIVSDLSQASSIITGLFFLIVFNAPFITFSSYPSTSTFISTIFSPKSLEGGAIWGRERLLISEPTLEITAFIF